MFGFFAASPTKKLHKQYQTLLQDAMQAQRSGNIRLYSELSEKADLILKQLESLEKSEAENNTTQNNKAADE